MNNALQILPVWLIILYVFIIGICIGSLLNVLALRGLSGEDVVFARSKCPKCLKQLTWYMNIPLFSYLFLGGKCGFCKTKISIQYPIVEFITGVLFVFSYLAFGLNLKFLFVCVILSIFVVLALTDILETVVLDVHTYILAIVGFLYSALNLGDVAILHALIGAVLSFLLMEIIARIGSLFAGIRIFGEGDSLIAIGLGAIFGIKGYILILALSCIIQSFFSIPVLLSRAYKQGKIKLTFAYFLVILFLITSIAVNMNGFLNNAYWYFIYLLALIISMTWSFVVIIVEIKHKKEEFIENNSEDELTEDKNPYSLMPFGPALIFSGAICLFYFDSIKIFVRNLLF